MREYNVAILGATGAVGTRMIEQLAQSNIPVKKLKLLASKKSVGQKRYFNGTAIVIEEATPASFDNIDLVFSSAGGSVSKKLLPEAVKRGAVCVDNTSAFRMEPRVPLVVPEVNPDDLAWHHGIIANPNCSTIQMVVALNPIRRKFGLNRIIVSTYQAASGAGQSALNELNMQAKQMLAKQTVTTEMLPVKGEKRHFPLAFNLLPQIDVFEDDGYTHEEWKMIHETKKIMVGDMNDTTLKVTATCVRVPVEIGHGETVYFETGNEEINVEDIQKVIANGDGLELIDDPTTQTYPTPLLAVGHRETFVGRVRADQEEKGAFHMWVVADNLLKGAAWNAIQIGECLVARDLVRVVK